MISNITKSAALGLSALTCCSESQNYSNACYLAESERDASGVVLVKDVVLSAGESGPFIVTNSNCSKFSRFALDLKNVPVNQSSALFAELREANLKSVNKRQFGVLATMVGYAPQNNNKQISYIDVLQISELRVVSAADQVKSLNDFAAGSER